MIDLRSAWWNPLGIGPGEFERGFTTGTTGAVAVPRDRDSPTGDGEGEANVAVTAGEPGREEGGDWGAKKEEFCNNEN